MKIVKEFIKREIAGEALLVPTGQTAQEFNGMISLSEVGSFIWDHLEESQSLDHLLDMITTEYDIDRTTAQTDAMAFIMQLLRNGMVRPESDSW